jgi:hypothetical protein
MRHDNPPVSRDRHRRRDARRAHEYRRAHNEHPRRDHAIDNKQPIDDNPTHGAIDPAQPAIRAGGRAEQLAGDAIAEGRGE